jgi:hypothetical protein
MDTSGCPPGWATDMWLVSHASQPCAVPVAAFFTVLLFYIVVKLLVLYPTWRFWLKRYRDMKKIKGPLAQRHPIVPSLVTALAMFYILIVSLVGANVASARNGGGTALYGVMSSVWGVYCLFHVKKYISLGRKLIPLAQARYRPDGTASSDGQSHSSTKKETSLSTAAETSLSVLSKADRPLQVMQVMMMLNVMVLFIISILPTLLYPAEERWPRAMLGLVGTYALCLYVSLMWHLERLVNATRICGQTVQSSQGTRKLQHAIKIMRVSQVVWFVTGNITFLSHLLAAVYVIDLSWILLLCMMLIETSTSVFAFLATRSRPRRERQIPDTTTNKDTLAPGGSTTRFNHVSASAGSFVAVAVTTDPIA